MRRPTLQIPFLLSSLHGLVYISIMGSADHTLYWKRQNASQHPASRADLVWAACGGDPVMSTCLLSRIGGLAWGHGVPHSRELKVTCEWISLQVCTGETTGDVQFLHSMLKANKPAPWWWEDRNRSTKHEKLDLGVGKDSCLGIEGSGYAMLPGTNCTFSLHLFT